MSKIKKFVVAALAVCAQLLPIRYVLAQAQTYDPYEGLNKIGEASGLGTGSDASKLPTTIGTLLNVVIGTLGFIFLILAVYAGFKIMLSQGGDDYKTGKKTLLYAVIGMIVIASAYALSTFVISQLSVIK